MTLEKLIKVPIYDFAKIKVIVSDKVLDIPILKTVVEEDDDFFKGIVFTRKGTYYMVLNMQRLTHPNTTIPHECAHLVFDILETAGIKLGRKSKEAYTYLLGHLTEEVFKIYEKYLQKNLDISN